MLGLLWGCGLAGKVDCNIEHETLSSPTKIFLSVSSNLKKRRECCALAVAVTVMVPTYNAVCLACTVAVATVLRSAHVRAEAGKAVRWTACAMLMWRAGQVPRRRSGHECGGDGHGCMDQHRG